MLRAMELRTEIEIDASPAVVWGVLCDFPRYAEWNPFIPQISGELRVGAKLEVVISPPGGREMSFRPRILVVDPEKELRWRGRLFVPGLFDGEHFFCLVGVAQGRTRLAHGEDFTGLLVKLAGRALTNTARGFVFMNQALKRRVEEGPED
jgi:hypothetical protein